MPEDIPTQQQLGVSANGDSPGSPFAEVGTTGLKRFGGEVQEEFDPNLRGVRGVRVYDEMRRNDPDIGAILSAILHVALGSTWAAVCVRPTPIAGLWRRVAPASVDVVRRGLMLSDFVMVEPERFRVPIAAM